MKGTIPMTRVNSSSKSNYVLTFTGLDCTTSKDCNTGERVLEVRIPASDRPSKVPTALVDDHKLTDTQVEEIMDTVTGMMAMNHLMGHRVL